jgi:hypothetical protein
MSVERGNNFLDPASLHDLLSGIGVQRKVSESTAGLSLNCCVIGVGPEREDHSPDSGRLDGPYPRGAPAAHRDVREGATAARLDAGIRRMGAQRRDDRLNLADSHLVRRVHRKVRQSTAAFGLNFGVLEVSFERAHDDLDSAALR